MHVLVIPSERYVPKDSPLEGMFQQSQAKALKDAGFHVGIISPQWRPIRSLRKAFSGGIGNLRVEEDQGIPVFRNDSWPWIPPLYRGRVWHWLQVGKILFKRYMKAYGKPDILHAHNARFAGILAGKIKERWGIPFILTEHSSAYVRGFIHPWEMGYIREAFRDASKRIVVSPGLGHTLEDILGKVVFPWEWIPNILDDLFEKNPGFRETNGSNAHPFRFLNVGALIEIKGQADLLHAFAQKFRGEKDVELRIAGEGPLRKSLHQLVVELNIADQVVFLGPLGREKVYTEMKTCNVYVHPSHYESFGVTLIEALSCGKPVIGTSSGGPECIIKEGNGVLVPCRDIGGFGGAMVQMRKEIENYDAAWIRQDCIERFGSRTIVGKLSSVYRQTVAQEEKARE